MTKHEKQTFPDELTWYTSGGHSVAFLPENASDDTIMRALTKPAYDKDFVGPCQPLMRGELGEIYGIRVVTSPLLKEKALASLLKPKVPKKHWRRW
jgi:hypothetical protein